MIFNNALTEQEIVESLINDAKNERGMIYKSYYDEENNELALANFYYESYLNGNSLIKEANISQDDLGIARFKKAARARYIMITGSGNSSHGGRMKVSAPGKHITRSNHDYISIYRADSDIITYIGNIKDIDMSKKEYKIYEDLFIRNEDLIWAIYNSRGSIDAAADNAIISDEYNRRQGYTVLRDRDTGDAAIYDGNVLIKRVPLQ